METERIEANPQERRSLYSPSYSRKGGLRTIPFIIVNESFERFASYGLLPNMIIYLMKSYHFNAASASSILFIWSAISNGLAIFGAFISDSYLGRFRVIAIGSLSSLLGMSLLWLTAVIPELKPQECNWLENYCNPPKAAQITFLYFSFLLISIGAGCVRPCSIAFGADQLNKKEDPHNEGVLESFFNWYYASSGISIVLGMSVIVYTQDHFGWKIGLGIPAILMVFSTVIFLMGSSIYIRLNATKSLFTGFLQVPVAAFRKRKLHLPLSEDYNCYHGSQDSKRLAPTNQFRCLNKASVIQDPVRELNSDGLASNPWSLCSVEQVEALKSLLSVIPMWTTSIMLLASMNQGVFSTLQAKTMDRHLSPKFEIPAASFDVFLVLALTIWILIYDRVLAPLIARYTGQQRGLSPITRIGIGLIFSCLAMAVGAITESIRRKKAIEQGLKDHPDAVMTMSAMWLVPRFALLGIAEPLNAIGQIEFFYSQFPKTMSSIAVAIHTLAIAVASLLGSLLVNIVDRITKQGGRTSWLSSNLNRGHLDYYYWLLTFLNVANFLYFMVCCRLYKPSNTRNVLSSEVKSSKESENGALPSA